MRLANSVMGLSFCLMAISALAQDAPVDRLPPIDDVGFNPPPEVLSALGGKTWNVRYEDGVITDLSRDREIAFRWRYPADYSGSAPLVIVSHGGYGSDRGFIAYPHLGSTYARFGFITLSINHKRSTNEQQHRYDRAVDVSFIIDVLTAAAWRGGAVGEQLKPPADFGGEIDLHKIGHTGHSFGGFTAHAVGGADFAPTLGIKNFRDNRVRAIVPISPQGADRFGSYDHGVNENSWSGIHIPVYLLAGGAEGPEWRRQPYDRYQLPGDKFLTIGAGQNHGQMGNSGSDDVRRLLGWNTALFFHIYLRLDDEPAKIARCRIGTLGWLDGWTLERKLEGAGC